MGGEGGMKVLEGQREMAGEVDLGGEWWRRERKMERKSRGLREGNG